MFYDLHVYTSDNVGGSSLDEIIEFAKKLGLDGLGIVKFHGEEFELPKPSIDLVKVRMIKTNDIEELLKIAKKIRNSTEVLSVYGGNYDINRTACESSFIDILCHPDELGRRDSGLDHICIKSAQDNNVAIEINFREILESYKRHRVHVLSLIKKNISLCAKYETPIVTTSGALSKWDLRTGRELAAIAHLMGLELGRAISTVSTLPEQIVKTNREKLAGKRWEGVSIVE